MTIQSDARFTSSLKTYSRVAGAIVVLVGGLVLLGWQLDLESLKRVLPGLVAMNPATAIAFILCGASLWLLVADQAGHNTGRIAKALAGTAVLIGLLKFCAIAAGWHVGVDQLFFSTKLDIDPIYPNRMAPTTAFNFVLIGLALMLVDVETKGRLQPAQWLALVVSLIALLAVIGYLYGVGKLTGFAAYIPMALNTATAFLMLSAGLFLARPDRGLMAVVTSDTLGGVLVQRLLLAIILIPALLGWLRLAGQRAGLYHLELGVALMVVGNIFFFLVLLWWNVGLLGHMDTERTKDLVMANKQLKREVRERKQAEEELKKTLADLERSNKELERFAYVASHDLQEPLRMVSSYTQLLERRYKSKLDNDAQEFIAYAVDGANRMQRLIRDLLVYSRVSTRGKPFKPADCNIVLGQVRANLDVAIAESNALITNDELPIVMADETQLLQVFQNLISNAIKFRGEKPPHVQVSAEKNGNEWVFSVRDNGKGIEPQYYDRIFVIFQRLHTKEEYPGTGIGLAICKIIVERHGGRIWLESEPGKGSAFYFTILMK